MGNIPLIIISALVNGSVYGMVGMLFTMIYMATKVINFAQGEFIMVGAMLSVFFLLTLKFPFFLGILIIAMILTILGIVTERVAINPLFKKKAPVFTMIIATFAIGTILSSGASLTWGAKYLYVPSILGTNTIKLGKAVSIMPQEILVIAINGLIVSLLWVFYKKTMTGLAIRATGFNDETAKLIGVNVTLVIMITFALCSALSGIVGVLMVPLTGAFAFMGLPLSIKGFIAAIIGGFEKPVPAMLGGLLVGLFETLSSFYISTAYSEAIVYSILFILFVIKPTGLVSKQ